MKTAIGLSAMALVIAGCTTLGSAGSSGGSTSADPSAAIVAALSGGLVARANATGLDARETALALQAEYRALEYTPAGQAVPWTSGRAGTSGEVVAAQPYRVGSQDCRQYVHRVNAGGQIREARGSACRNPDGSWALLT